MEELYQSRYTGPEIDRRLGLMAGNFLWIKWSATYPVVEMLDEPGPYIGIYTGEDDTPPDDPDEYKWYLNSGAAGQPGPEGPEGPAGPPNALTIGTVQSGTTANATITGTAPEQTLNLVLPKGDTGTGLDILGTYVTVEALEAAITSPAQGDMYNVGEAAPYHVYMWDTTEPPSAWIDQGILQGPPGQDGAQGQDGKSGVFYGPVEDAPEDATVIVDPDGDVFTTDNVPEGETNLYFTNERVDDRLAQYKIGTTPDLPLFTGEEGAVGTKTAAEARTALGAAKAPVAQTVTLLAADWTTFSAGYVQTIDVPGIRAASLVLITPHPDYYDIYVDSRVRCSVQGWDALTFAAKAQPENNIDVNVLIVG